MRLVINKAKRETVSSCIFGFGILGVLINLGFFIYLPISNLVKSGKFISFKQLFPFDKELLTPVPGLVMCILFFVIAFKLKKDDTWISQSYDKLGPGTLILIMLLSIWVILPLLGNVIKTIVM